MTTPKGYRHGQDHPHARLTDHEVELLRRLRDEGMTLAALADKFDISRGHASKIANYHLRERQAGQQPTMTWSRKPTSA